MNDLLESQRAALTFVRERAAVKRSAVRRSVGAILAEAGLSMGRFDAALAAIRNAAPIDVSFHPDRLDVRGTAVVDDLLGSGRYRNQFETGISNGGVTAFEGGERDLWEQHLFGGAYQRPGVAASDRPKYGALNLLNHWDGACPRFGCCYFRLKPSVAERCTFAFGDSSTEPEDLGTIDVFDPVLAAVVEAIRATGAALGGRRLSIDGFLTSLSERVDFHTAPDFGRPPGRSLDESIEVHVHGAVELAGDVECLVADGGFRGTDTGRRLTALTETYGFALHWTPGLFLSVADVPADFRGPVMVPLARHVAADGVLDAVKIGRAAVSLRTDPAAWRSWGTFEETLQYIKQLWHVLATFGRVGEPTGD